MLMRRNKEGKAAVSNLATHTRNYLAIFRKALMPWIPPLKVLNELGWTTACTSGFLKKPLMTLIYCKVWEPLG